MPIKARENRFGAWAFLLGAIIAIVVGIVGQKNTNPIIFGVLAVIGLIAGFFVAQKDIQTFLFAAVALVLVSFAGMQGVVLDAAIRGVAIGKMVSSVLSSLMVLFVPATIVVALKTVFSIST